MKKKSILAISGSTRAQSINHEILKMLSGLSSEKIDFQIYNNLENLPHFNPDLDKYSPPTSVVDFRKLVEESNGVLFCTPEYVFSLPGSLKNAIEWTVSTTVFTDKPVAIITAAASGEKAHESLSLIMKTLQAQLSDNTQLLIRGAKGKIKANGEIDEDTLQKVKQLFSSFEKRISEAND